MITLDAIHTADPLEERLSLFKSFASIADGSQDLMLTSLLKSAMVAVGDWHDVSLLAQTLRLSVTGREKNDPVYLYRNAGEITSVVDGHGLAIGYQRKGSVLLLDRYTEDVVIEYGTEVYGGNLDRLMPKVCRYATAMYDGEDSEVLNRILMER